MPKYKYDFLGWKFSIVLDEDHPLNDPPLDTIGAWAKESELLGDDVSLFRIEELPVVGIALNENGAVEEEPSNTRMLTFLTHGDPLRARQSALAWLDDF